METTGPILFSSNSRLLQPTFSGQIQPKGGNGNQNQPSNVLITVTMPFPSQASPSQVLDTTVNVQWKEIAEIGLLEVSPEGGGHIGTFLKAYSITLTSQVVGSGNATVNIELAVPGNATIGDEGILFDIVFSALGVTSKTYRVDTFISVVSPLTASPPSPQDAKTISSPALFGLFLAVTIFRRSRKPRIP